MCMGRSVIYMIFFLLLFVSVLFGQEPGTDVDSVSGTEKNPVQFRYSGQLSGWGQFTPDLQTKGWMGGRYVPQVNLDIPLKNRKLIDFEASANLFGDIGIRAFEDRKSTRLNSSHVAISYAVF